MAAATLAIAPFALYAQALASAKQLGTVKSIAGGSITLTSSSGVEVTVHVSPDASVLQLPPGSTDLKSASPAKLADISVGDRILAGGKAGESAASLTATRIVLMKSGDIAARNAEQERDWQRRGLGGLVRTVDDGNITIVSGTKTLTVSTSPTTVFKRYAADSVSYADVKPAARDAIKPGDQLRARGAVADDRMSMTADEVVFGTFENLSGAISSIDLAAQTLTLKDLTTKKVVTIAVTPNSNLRNLPPQAAAAFAARNSSHGTGGGGGEKHASSAPAGANPSSSPANGSGDHSRSASADLSQMLARLPAETLADLKAGQAVMIVASEGPTGNPTAINLLSGVEQILSATPGGQSPVTLLPFSISMPGGDSTN